VFDSAISCRFACIFFNTTAFISLHTLETICFCQRRVSCYRMFTHIMINRPELPDPMYAFSMLQS
jgi:hypothetical protein